MSISRWRTLCCTWNLSLKESTVVFWHSLTFWTAVGEIGLGVLVGSMIGVLARRARRLAKPPATSPQGRICPGCGAPSLRRVRGSSLQRLLSVFTRRWPHVCLRCDWPSRSPTRPAKRPLGWRTPESAPRAVLNREWTLDQPHLPNAQGALHTIRALDTEGALATDRAFETRGIAADDTDLIARQDDVTEIKNAVFRYLALLNAGDVIARATCSLSESTSFGVDGGPLTSNVLDWRAAAPDAAQVYDLRCRDLRVYVHQDTAIATGYVVGTVAGRNGAAKRVTGRGSWVHLRQNGEWKLAHNHVSPLKPNAV